MRKRTGAGEEAFRLNRAPWEGKPDTAMHFDNLHDQNESEAGDKTDLATGKPINNSTQDPGAPVISKRTVKNAPLGRVVEPDDAAEQWLRANDPKRQTADTQENNESLD